MKVFYWINKYFILYLQQKIRFPTAYHNKAEMPKGKTYNPASVGFIFYVPPIFSSKFILALSAISFASK